MSDRELGRFMDDFWRVYLGELNVELADYLRSLRSRFRTALLSNSFIGARREEERAYDFSELVDLIVYSHEEGVAKPNARIYDIACERLGLPADEIVFLDDVEEYVAGAREAGMHSVRYVDNAQTVADIEAVINGA